MLSDYKPIQKDDEDFLAQKQAHQKVSWWLNGECR